MDFGDFAFRPFRGARVFDRLVDAHYEHGQFVTIILSPQNTSPNNRHPVFHVSFVFEVGVHETDEAKWCHEVGAESEESVGRICIIYIYILDKRH